MTATRELRPLWSARMDITLTFRTLLFYPRKQSLSHRFLFRNQARGCLGAARSELVSLTASFVISIAYIRKEAYPFSVILRRRGKLRHDWSSGERTTSRSGNVTTRVGAGNATNGGGAAKGVISVFTETIIHVRSTRPLLYCPDHRTPT